MAEYIDLQAQPTSVQLAAHAIGLDHERPYIRHGKLFYRPYRNYFATHENCVDAKEWTILVTCGFAHLRRSDQDAHKITFWMTRRGLDWLGHQLGITIHDEEE